MDKILSLTERLEDKKRERRKENQRLRAEAVLRTVQCSSCNHTCAMCGCHSDSNSSSSPNATSSAKVNLCKYCRAEYSDFLKSIRGIAGQQISWHNDEWIRLWSAWVEFRSSLNDFRNSPEFRKLIKDFDQMKR